MHLPILEEDALLSEISVLTEIGCEKEESWLPGKAQARLIRCRRRATNRYPRHSIGIAAGILEINQNGHAHQIRCAIYTAASAPPRIRPSRARRFISADTTP